MNRSLKRKMHIGNHVRVSKKENHYSPWFPIKQCEEMGFLVILKTLKIIKEVFAEQQFQSCVFFKEALDPGSMKQEITGSFVARHLALPNTSESSFETSSQETPEFCLASSSLAVTQ